MNKKGFIFSFFLFVFSFLFIGNVKAYTFHGVNLNQQFFDNAWDSVITPRGYTKNLYNNVVCTYQGSSGGSLDCRFAIELSTNLSNGTYWITFNQNTFESGKSWLPGFKYVISSHTYSLSEGSFSINKSNSVTNTDVYDSNNNKIWSKAFDYAPTSSYNVNIHLNGGESIDNTTMPTIYRNFDFSIVLNSNDISNYVLNHLYLNKKNHTFMGWYYDSEFTQPFNSNDIISSDIDLYAKFRNDVYSSSNIDYVEFKFDNLPLMEFNLNYSFNFKNVDSNGNLGDVEFVQPYGREFYTGCNDDLSSCSSDLKYKDRLFYDIGYISNRYSYEDSITLNSNPEHVSSSYSIIVPFEYDYNNSFYLYVDSSRDYEIIIHYKEDNNSVNSFIDSIDITGKYGAVFLPKFNNSPYDDVDGYYLTNFRVIGDVDIQMTDSRDVRNYNVSQIYSMNYCNNSYMEQNNIPYSCDNLTGVFTFKIDNLTYNQTLRFVNHSYSEMSDKRTIIEFDSRYFNYGILDTPYSYVEIIDPITNNTENVDLTDFYGHTYSASIEESKLTFKSAFNRFLGPIKFIFRCITSLYNNYLSSSLRHYFFLAFSLSLIILLVRIIF